jgi:hypothetical protein
MPVPTETFALAAAAEPRLIHRIPASPTPYSLLPAPPPSPSPFDRPEGSFAARAFGNATHAFLELLATRIAAGATLATLLAELRSWQPRIAAVLRANGIAPTDVDRYTQNVLRALAKTLNDPDGQWLLAPHPQAASESSVTTPTETLRLDRTFLAGPTPQSPGTDHLWIVDYKTSSHGTGDLQGFLAEEKRRYAPILETYARALANNQPQPIRLALYYPLLSHLLWWEPPSTVAISLHPL